MELTVNLDDTLSVPLYRQLYEALRVTILAGRLPRGQRLPSSRSLARQLSVSRNTVNQAYGELEAEGYLWGRHGSGTFVSQELPDDRPHGATFLVGTLPTGARRELALRTRINGANTEDTAAPVTLPPAGLPYDFHPGQGAWDAFPREVWRRLLARQWRTGWHEAMDYGDPAGYRPLREQVAAYLARSRAVRCTPEQVVIVNGTQQALDLLARVLLEPGDRVAVENPGYRAARQVFASYRADLLPVSVDDEGMMVDRLRDSGARIVLVAPSHQFPSGSVLSLRRRLSLLAWARSGGGLVVEDDYDSEFRFEGRPLASLQGLDDAGCVVYLGSFSKVLFPALRVGYAVLPRGLIGPFQDAKDLTDRQTPILEQQVLAGFLGEGHFERHVRKMRQLYRVRREFLVASLERHLAGACQVVGAKAGMHLMVRLPPRLEEAEVVARAAEEGVAVYPASPYYCGSSPGPALLLGYGGMTEDSIQRGVERLARALRLSGGLGLPPGV